MAKLPDETALGARPVPQPTGQRAIAGMKQDISGYGNMSVQQGLQDAAQNMAQIAQRIQTRDDAVELARAKTTYSRSVNDEFLRSQTEEDWSKNETGRLFRDHLVKQREQILSGFSGSPNARARLQAGLMEMEAGYLDKAAVHGLEQKKIVTLGMIDDTYKSLYNGVYENPGSYQQSYEVFKTTLDEMAPALTKKEYEDWLEQGARLATAAISSHLDKGDVLGAEEILGLPGVVESLPPDQQLSVRSRVASQRGAQDKDAKSYQRRRDFFVKVMGRQPTPQEEVQMYPGMPAFKSGMTKAEEARALQAEFGWSNEQVNKYLGADIGDGGFGGGVTGKSLQHMIDIAPLVEGGLATDEDLLTLEAAVTEYTQPRMSLDPVTGQPVWTRPQLPPFMRRALAAQGRQFLAPAPNVDTPSPPPAQTTTIEFDGSGGYQSSLREGQTIWSLAPSAAGPVPAIGAAARRIPLIGDVIGSQKMHMAREAIPRQNRALVTALQRNPRWAEGERTSIETELNVNPRIFDNEQSYLETLVGLDDFLRDKQDHALKSANNTSLPKEDRAHWLTSYNDITKYLSDLGVPPRVYEDEGSPDKNKAFLALEPGQEFIFVKADGTIDIGVKPNQGGSGNTEKMK